MKAPLSWLLNYVDINITDQKTFAKEFASAMTMSGSKVEAIEIQGEEISNVVVGKIVALEKHPDADKLQVTKVDVGSEVIQIVTGAHNISVGDYIPVALVKATLPGGKKISKGKLRGVESYGMMCSIQELELTKEDYPNAAEDGIFILEGEPPLGKDIKELLGLNESIIEFEITPNRPDCLNIVGLAREAAVTYRTKFKKPEIVVKEEGEESEKYASVQITDPHLCSRYTARVVKDVKIGQSPKWMKDRLKAAGVRPINNIVDITNYVMLEIGQPIHGFDLERLHEGKIVVRRANEGEQIRTLDGKDRELDTSILVIADAEKPVALAGVMGGENSEVSDTTTTVLFEAANFNIECVRQTSKKIGLKSEASKRLEKLLDPELTIIAVNRVAQLVEMLGIGTVCKGILDCQAKQHPQNVLKFRPDRINSFLGTSVDSEQMIEILKQLEFEFNEDYSQIKVPGFRTDIEGEADLAEEVARFYGYNNIEATILEGRASTQGKKTFKQKVEDKIKDTMVACGMYEIFTYSFTSPKVFDKIKLPQDSQLRNAVVISNPLGEDYSIMRTTTIPEMLDVISRNYNRRVESGRFFELCNVYSPQTSPDQELPSQKMVLTLGMYGDEDFYSLKGVVEELFDALRIYNYEFEPEKDNPTFHSGRTAKILLKGQNIGVIGEIHPEVADNFQTSEKTYIGVIEVLPLVENATRKIDYKPLPKYPSMSRDIAMLVKDEIMVKEIEDIIKKESGSILENVKLFDVYKGQQIPEGMKSVAYSIVFRGADRTLTDEEVNEVMGRILEGLKNKIGAELR